MRKLVILAREAGYDIEPDAVRVESLVPAGCEEGSVDHFFENGEELNEQMVQRLEAANEMGLVLRYVARFEANGKARVGVEAVRPEHPLEPFSPTSTVWLSCCNSSPWPSPRTVQWERAPVRTD